MWDKKIVDDLIIKYKQHENLYDVRNPLYLDCKKRSNSLYSICQELKKYNKKITPDDIKKKIHTLRSQYIKESKEIAKSKRIAVRAEDVYVPKLWCFSKLAFLKPHCILRKPMSKVSETDESDNSFFALDEEISVIMPNIVKPSCKKRTDESDNSSFVIDREISEINSNKSASSCNKAQSSYNKRRESLNLEERSDNLKKIYISNSEQKSCYDWLGQQVVFEICRLKNEKIQREAVWSIQQILRNASLEDEQTADLINLSPNYIKEEEY